MSSSKDEVYPPESSQSSCPPNISSLQHDSTDAEIKAQTPEDSELNNSPLQTPFAVVYYKNAPWYSYTPPPPQWSTAKKILYPPPPLPHAVKYYKKYTPAPPPTLAVLQKNNFIHPHPPAVEYYKHLPPPPHTHTHTPLCSGVLQKNPL